ncbi:DUF4157 domain-containing protein [Amycolatopsis sp. GA6-003]|uniref:eCIS core domain-containing protein n=1 Tax=Amycolatopsis sp. GA6-003 TaxID=2652444 RepID=UPI0039172F0C
MEHARPAPELARVSVPGTVPEVLHEPGRPLDRAIQARAEAELHWDFSRVRVRTSGRAARAARAIGATAYTLGKWFTAARELSSRRRANSPCRARACSASTKSSRTPKCLARLGTDFGALRKEVGNASTLTPGQRRRAEAILDEARPLGNQQYADLRGRINQQLRTDSCPSTTFVLRQ